MTGSNEISLGATLRALRRRADFSQRELAERAGVPSSTVARIEAGQAWDPKFRTVERLVRAAGGAVSIGAGPATTDIEANPHEELRDGADRHYPAHLDVREVHDAKDWAGAWWAHWYNLPPERWPLRVPDATYDLSRERRDRRRWREEIRRTVRLRRVTGGLPETAWRWVAELPDGRLVGELRARRRAERPIYDDLLRWRVAPAAEIGAAVDPGVERGLGPRYEVVLDGVVVTPDYRGLGIGRRLIEELVAEMDRVGIVVARAVAEFEGIDFLAACGFQAELSRPAKLTLLRRSWSPRS